MAVRTTTLLQRQIIKNLRTPDGTNPYTLPDRLGTGTENLNFRYVSEETRIKNPTTEPLYPGWSLEFLAPRENRPWQTVENVAIVRPDPADTDHDLVDTYSPPQACYLDFRLSLYAKVQPQFNAMVHLLFSIWHRGHAQHAISWPDDDDSDILYTAAVSFSAPVPRNRPADNVLAADYLLSVPISLYTLAPVALPRIEQVLLNFGVLAADGSVGLDVETLVLPPEP